MVFIFIKKTNQMIIIIMKNIIQYGSEFLHQLIVNNIGSTLYSVKLPYFPVHYGVNILN